MTYDDALVIRTAQTVDHLIDSVEVTEVWDLCHPACPIIVMGQTSGHYALSSLMSGLDFRMRFGAKAQSLLAATGGLAWEGMTPMPIDNDGPAREAAALKATIQQGIKEAKGGLVETAISALHRQHGYNGRPNRYEVD